MAKQAKRSQGRAGRAKTTVKRKTAVGKKLTSSRTKKAAARRVKATRKAAGARKSTKKKTAAKRAKVKKSTRKVKKTGAVRAKAAKKKASRTATRKTAKKAARKKTVKKAVKKTVKKAARKKAVKKVARKKSAKSAAKKAASRKTTRKKTTRKVAKTPRLATRKSTRKAAKKAGRTTAGRHPEPRLVVEPEPAPPPAPEVGTRGFEPEPVLDVETGEPMEVETEEIEDLGLYEPERVGVEDEGEEGLFSRVLDDAPTLFDADEPDDDETGLGYDVDEADPAAETESGVRVGQMAPDFALADEQGRIHTLASYRGRRVVLFFYPKDDTPGCTTEACSFRDLRRAFEARNVAVLGISPDPVDSHVAFARKYGLTFPLLADESHAVAERYGVWRPRDGGEPGIARTTFVIDEEGRVDQIFHDVRPENHAQEVLDWLDGLERLDT